MNLRKKCKKCKKANVECHRRSAAVLNFSCPASAAHTAAGGQSRGQQDAAQLTL